jgi:hypothetical protein
MTLPDRAASRLLVAAAALFAVSSLPGAPVLAGDLGQPSSTPDVALSQPGLAQSVASRRVAADTFRPAIEWKRSRDRSAGQTPASVGAWSPALALLLGGSIHYLRSARSISRRPSRAPRAPPRLLPG